MTKNNPPILLTEAFPYWLSGKGIFSEMDEPPWNGVVDADLLDLDYFGNHSGWKKCSPLLYKLFDSDYTLSDTNREKLADLVMAKFGPNWTALWNTYHTEYDPLQDFSITETGMSSGQQAKTKSNTHTGSENVNDSGSVTYGKSVSTSGSLAKDDDVTNNYGESVSVMGNNSATNTQSKWGFNSAEDVPTDKTVGEGSTTESTLHGGSDSSQRDISELTTGSETQSGSDSTQNATTKQQIYTDDGTENTSDNDSYEKHFSGLKGGITRQQLIEQERALWLEDYFSRIFMDIDSVLASLIYNREHRYYPYYPTGFGYYSI